MWFSKKSKSIKIRDVEIQNDKDSYFTIGLKSYIDKEILVSKKNLTIEQVKPIFQYIIEFVQDNKLKLVHGEKLSCFSWMVRLKENGEYFEVFEVFPQNSGFIPGVKMTVNLFEKQSFVCKQVNATSSFPLFDQTVTIDPLVKQGIATHLFRWKREDPDSGWVAMTDKFDGNPSSFQQLTVGQLITLRPEFAQFLALPSGFKVIWEGKDAKIGYDERMNTQ